MVGAMTETATDLARIIDRLTPFRAACIAAALEGIDHAPAPGEISPLAGDGVIRAVNRLFASSRLRSDLNNRDLDGCHVAALREAAERAPPARPAPARQVNPAADPSGTVFSAAVEHPKVTVVSTRHGRFLRVDVEVEPGTASGAPESTPVGHLEPLERCGDVNGDLRCTRPAGHRYSHSVGSRAWGDE